MATLIITEKPTSSLKLAQALGKPKEKTSKGVSYYEVERDGKRLIIAPAVGHLFVLAEKKKKGWTYPVFATEWKPIFEQRDSVWSKKYFQNLERLAEKATEFISACDYDIEGSVIAYNILRFICKTEEGKRMKFSTLTKPDLVAAYENASPKLDFEQIEAGLARHQLDYMWGINVSRALTLSLKRAGRYKILSTGRVQGPALALLQKREKEIASFVPAPYWELLLHASIDGQDLPAEHVHGEFWKKEEADHIHTRCKGKPGTIHSVESKPSIVSPPTPFDLTTLQRESYAQFGYSPKMTLDIAQSLYEAGAISYPRTSSQKLPPQIGYRTILEALGKKKDYQKFVKILLKGELKPNEGPKSDPAHPSIYPTPETPSELNQYQKKLYDLIVKRFLSVFAPPAKREQGRITIDVEGEHFRATGVRTIEAGWMEFYAPYSRYKELLLPEVKKGQTALNHGLDLLDKQTQPPNRFTQASMLKKLEDLGLGTKATRAQILETLYDRGYVQDKSIKVTMLGAAVAESLEKYCADIMSEDLTRKFENEMEAIQEGKTNKEKVLAEAQETLTHTLDDFKKNEEPIGKELVEGLKESQRLESTIGPCQCGGTLMKRRSKAGKPFVGCDAYPKCTQTYSLPHFGFTKALPDKCECGLFIVLVISKGKRPWKLCVKDGFKK